MIKATMPGVAGNCVSAVSFSLAWMTTNGLPLLHIASVLVGILASVATAGYYIVSWQAARKERDRTAAKRNRARKPSKRK